VTVSGSGACEEPETVVLRATYRHGVEGRTALVTTVEFEIENTGAVAIESIPLLIGVPPDTLVGFGASDDGGKLDWDVSPRDRGVDVSIRPSSPVAPGSTYDATFRYTVEGVVDRDDETVELQCHNAIFHWPGSGVETFEYRVELPEGMPLVSSAPAGATESDDEGVTMLVKKSMQPVALWKVRCGTSAGLMTVHGWVYIIFALVAGAVAAALLVARSVHYRSSK